MSDTTIVRVTQRHIDQGKKGNACNCAFALAIIDALDNDGIIIDNVWVGSTHDLDCLHAEVRDTAGETRVARLGDDVSRWIGEFDDGFAVEPFEVTLTWEPTS